MLLAVAARRAGRLTTCLQEPQAIGVLRLNIRPVAAPRGPPCTPRPESGSASLARRPVCTTSILFSDLPQRLLGSATSASFAERLDHPGCGVLGAAFGQRALRARRSSSSPGSCQGEPRRRRGDRPTHYSPAGVLSRLDTCCLAKCVRKCSGNAQTTFIL